MPTIEKKFLPIFTGIIVICWLALANYFALLTGLVHASSMDAAFAPTACTGKNILFVGATRPRLHCPRSSGCIPNFI